MYISVQKHEHLIKNNCINSYPNITRVLWECRDLKILLGVFLFAIIWRTTKPRNVRLVDQARTQGGLGGSIEPPYIQLINCVL